MRDKITLILLLLSVYTIPVDAHLWGNFSVNNYSRINIEKNQIRLRCVLDMAEIPVFQESQQIDTDKNNALSYEEPGAYLEKLTTQYAANLKLFSEKHFSFL